MGAGHKYIVSIWFSVEKPAVNLTYSADLPLGALPLALMDAIMKSGELLQRIKSFYRTAFTPFSASKTLLSEYPGWLTGPRKPSRHPPEGVAWENFGVACIGST